MRALLASLLGLLCTVAVSSFVLLATLQTTVLSRTEVKAWLVQSNVYQSALSAFVTSDPTTAQQLATTPGADEAIISSLNKTFTADYVRGSTEKVIDGLFDWLEGKQPLIVFNIDASGQREAFLSNAVAALKDQLAALPACASLADFNAQNPTCIPPGTTVDQLATSIATDASNQLGIFREPITNQNITNTTSANATNSPLTSSHSSAQALPNVIASLQLLLWVLPLVATACGVCAILISANRLATAKRLAGKLAFGLGLTCIVGIALVVFGRSFHIDIAGASSTVTTAIVEPVLHQALPAIGTRLAIVSGLAAIIAIMLWALFRRLKQRGDREAMLSQPPTASLPPAAPQAPTGQPPQHIA